MSLPKRRKKNVHISSARIRIPNQINSPSITRSDPLKTLISSLEKCREDLLHKLTHQNVEKPYIDLHLNHDREIVLYGSGTRPETDAEYQASCKEHQKRQEAYQKGLKTKEEKERELYEKLKLKYG